VASGCCRQWWKDGTALEGATDSALVLSGVSEADEGDYSVVASDAHESVISQVARLTVAVKPVIIQAPLSQSVVEGGRVTFSVEISRSRALTQQAARPLNLQPSLTRPTRCNTPMNWPVAHGPNWPTSWPARPIASR